MPRVTWKAIPTTFDWKQDGVNNNQPKWVLDYGDYHADVLLGYDPVFLWSAKVNNSGKLGFETADDAKAYAEEQLVERLTARLKAADATIALYGAHAAQSR